jgi:segregation and condensation protein B
MRKGKPTSDEADDDAPVNPTGESPLSLSRLREAFAAMLGERGAGSHPEGTRQGVGNRKNSEGQLPSPYTPDPSPTGCEINPRTVVEAILFVGRPDNRPVSARELAAAMRGVSPSEIEAAIHELNQIYNVDVAPYRIEQTNAGYRMVLRDTFERMRDKFYGRVKEARLSPAALEVLSVLAYNQPATADQLNELRGAPSGAAISILVRRRLVKVDRPAGSDGLPEYSTTDRFLKLFGLESLAALPREEELVKI